MFDLARPRLHSHQACIRARSAVTRACRQGKPVTLCDRCFLKDASRLRTGCQTTVTGPGYVVGLWSRNWIMVERGLPRRTSLRLLVHWSYGLIPGRVGRGARRDALFAAARGGLAWLSFGVRPRRAPWRGVAQEGSVLLKEALPSRLSALARGMERAAWVV
jgi:hypothetical protein